MNRTNKLTLLTVLIVVMGCGAYQPSDETEKKYSGTNGSYPGGGYPGSIYGFRFLGNSTDGIISGNTITVKVPTGTNLTNLVAAFTTFGNSVWVGQTLQTSGVTANNFTGPVVYSVSYSGGVRRDYTVTVTTTGTDVFPPLISSFSVSPATATAFPVTITLRAYYTDYGSGFSSGNLTLCSPSYYGNNYSGQTRYTSSLTNMGSYVEATVQIGTFNESGTWRLCSASLTDVSGNIMYYGQSSTWNSGMSYYVYSSGYVAVESGIPGASGVVVSGNTPDTAAPVLTSVTVTPAAITAPGTVTIRAYYTESGSGYSSGYAILCSPGYLNSTGNATQSISLTNMGAYAQGTLNLTNFHQSGTWRVCTVSMTDAISNSNYYYYSPTVSTQNFVSSGVNTGIPMDGLVALTSSTPDTTRPQMTSITMTPSTVSTYPATVTVRIYYTETGAGWSSGYAILCSPSYLNGGSSTLLSVSSLTNMGAYLQGTVTLQGSHETGIWKICSLSLTDLAGNNQYYGYYSYVSSTNYYTWSNGPAYSYYDSGIPLTGLLTKN